MRASGGDHGSFLPPLTPRRSMEEVWGSITMSGSGQSPIFAAPPLFFPHPATTEHSSAAFRGIILQDFLAGASTDQSPNPQPPPPPTALSLNTTPVPHHSDSSSDTSHSHLWATGDGDRLLFSPENTKRATEKHLGDVDGSRSGSDRQQKRMMKNRESAARSRARKQAYTNDLEIEVARLAKENAMLRKQYEELRMAADAHALTTKRMLQRSSTTSF